jgi:hypothetical protein
MRQEEKLTPGFGDASLLHVGHKGELKNVFTQAVSDRSSTICNTNDQDAATGSEGETCGEAFLLGKLDENACLDTTAHACPVRRKTLCEEAAAEAGATVDADITVQKEPDDFGKHLAGCFKKTIDGKDKFYYSDADVEQSAPNQGVTPGETAVCHRPRYLNGTDGQATECSDTSYELIVTADGCRNAVSCLGHATEKGLFIVGVPANIVDTTGQQVEPRPAWATEYSNSPKGCFIRTDANGVKRAYYNEWQELDDAGNPVAGVDRESTRTAGTITGTPICQIAKWVA